MLPRTFIFLGPSGCGKGTQRKKIAEYLQAEDSGREIKELEMGALLREFWKQEGYTNRKSKEIVEKGGLQPSFIQVSIWSQFLVDNISGGEHLLIDGSPRRQNDAELMDTAFKFLKRAEPVFVFLKVGKGESKRRLMGRARLGGRDEDLSEEVIDSRLEWYEEFVVPAIDFFRGREGYNFMEIDGEQSPERVFKDIKQRAF